MEKAWRNYAKTALEYGINLQEGQEVLISSVLEAREFTELLVKEAYKMGAKFCFVVFEDEYLKRHRIENSVPEHLDYYPDWYVEGIVKSFKRGASMINIIGSDPEALKGVDPTLMSREMQSKLKISKPIMDQMSKNENTWCIIGYPSKAWAEKVYPEAEKPLESLKQAIFKVSRMDRDEPLKEWDEHKKKLKERRQYMNTMKFRELIYESPGTDLRIKLPTTQVWQGGSVLSKEGIEYIPNIPTEEIFTLPERTGVNGTVRGTMPLIYNGNEIEDFSFKVKDGRIVEVKAGKNEQLLKDLIETDEGSHYFGEVALVPNSSPISQLGTVFFNTLYDENASCHLAIGRAYPDTIEGGGAMEEAEFIKSGGNISLVHVDFMIGSADLNIYGIDQNGDKRPVFINGEWSLDQ